MIDVDRRDLICLHLAAHADVTDQSRVPEAVTATGVSDALQVGDTAVDRIGVLDELSTLEEEGVVRSDNRAVVGHAEPRRAYFLTDAGRDRAVRIRERVRDQRVVVTNGTRTEVLLGEIDRYFEDEPTPLVSALARLTAEGTVPIDQPVRESFVARDEELESVRETVAASFTRESRTVIVRGPVGVGKSTLVREAIDRVAADRDGLVRATGASPAGAAEPYTAFRQAFEVVPDGGELLDRLAAARSAFSPVDSEKVRAQRTTLFEDIADGLKTVATDQPLVVFLDNLHWADAGTIRLFDYLTASFDEWVYPVAFVATCRAPTGSTVDRLDGVLDSVKNEETDLSVRLQPLSKEDTRSLVGNVLGDPRPPEQFVDVLYDQTGGNPLFVRETATHLLESGIVDPDSGDYPTATEGLSLPQQLPDGIERRLSNLDEPARRLLRLGAVLGERISRAVLAEASSLPPDRRREYVDVFTASRIWERVDETEAELTDSESDSEAGQGRDLQFVSGGVREAVVERLPDETACDLHERAADGFEQATGEPQPARVAHHHEAAGNYERAIAQYRRAGERSTDAYANEEAVSNYERALRIARERELGAGLERPELLAELAAIYRTTGAFEEAATLVAEGLEHAPPESRQQCRLLGVRTSCQTVTGEYEDARESAIRQREIATEIDASEEFADACLSLGTVARRQGAFENARGHYEEGLEAAQEADDRKRTGRALKELGVVAWRFGEYDEAEGYFDRSLAIAEDLGDRDGVANNRNNLGILARMRSEYDRAREYFEGSLESYRDLGNREGEAASLNNLGTIEHSQNDYDDAREYYEQSLSIRRDLGDRRGVVECLLNLGQVLQSQGMYDSAGDYYEEGLSIATELGDKQSEVHCLLSLGKIARYRGEFDRSRQRLDRGLELAEEVGDTQTEGAYLMALGLVNEWEGRFDDATDCFQRALEQARDLENSRREATVLANFGRVARKEREFETARERFEAAASIASAVGIPEQQAAGLEGKAVTAIRQGNHDEAAKSLERAGDLLGGEPNSGKHAEIDLARARLELAKGDSEPAREKASAARDRFAERDRSHWVARCERVLGRVAGKSDEFEAAFEHWDEALAGFQRVGASYDRLRTARLAVQFCEARDLDSGFATYCEHARDALADAPAATTRRFEEWVAQQCPDDS
jgi:tetratricopeptide (TPR) repeat protein